MSECKDNFAASEPLAAEVLDEQMRKAIRQARAGYLRQTRRAAGDASASLTSAALARAGKGKEEIKAVSDVDDAQATANKHRLKPGAVQTAMVSKHLPLHLFARSRLQFSAPVQAVRERSLKVAGKFLADGELFDRTGAFNPVLEQALTDAGFYGLLICTALGGAGATMQETGAIMLEIGRLIGPVVPGTLSIKTMIGPVGALRYLCGEELQKAFLTWMATKMFQGAFAATEPGFGCNITKMKTFGVIDDDKLRLWGEKCFISRAVHGGWVAIFLTVNGKFKIAIAQLPDQNTDTFRLRKYDLHVLQPELMNNGLIFNGFEIPIEQLLPGDGLAAIFHDLDDGRWAVAVGASVLMTVVLASCPRWVNKRMTMGKPLAHRQGIQYRMALIAAYIAGSDALSLGAASQIDEQRAGDVLAMIAKTWSTNALRKVMTVLGLEIHGGRVFVKGKKGSPVGNNILNALVACVYEGPNPMLAMAAINLLIKAIQTEGLADLHQELGKAGVNLFDLMVKVELNRLPKALAWLTDRSKLVRSQLHLMAKKNGQAKTLGTTLVALANKPRTVQLRLFATLLRSSTAMVKKTTKIVEKLAQAKSAIKLLWSHRHVHGVVGLSTNGHLYIRNELRFDIYVNDKRIERHAKVPIKTTDVIVLGVKGARLNLETQTDDHAAGEAQAARVYVNGIELNAGNELPIGGIFHNRKTIIPAARKFGLFYWNVKRSVKHGKVARALPEELIEEAQVIEDERFARHLDFAAKAWFKWRSDSLDLVFKYGPKLADEQLVLEFDMYEPVESIVALFRAIQEGQEALDNGDQGTASALNMLCAVLKADLQGKKHTTPEIKAAVKETFDHIMAGTFRPMAGVPVAEICLDYLDEDDASLEAAA